MASISDLKKIIAVKGVGQYVFLDPTGKVIAQEMENHLLISAMIISCLSICKTIENNQFRHLIFPQPDGQDLFLFPVGKYYLGVYKEAQFDAAQLPKNIYNFILALNEKKANTP